MIKNISNVDLSAMNGWGSKARDGCLQARAINVLHSICVSDYYHYYYQYYYYYCYYYQLLLLLLLLLLLYFNSGKQQS